MEDKTLLLSNLCKDYYLENHTIHDISQKYNLSRYKILKFLDEAKELGIVRIDVKEQFERHSELEGKLESFFPTHFFVLKEDSSFIEHESIFWKFCAFYIQQHISQDKIINLSFGDSLFKTVEQFTPSYEGEHTFVPFLGDNQRLNNISNPSFIAYQCSKIYHAKYLKLSCPLYTSNAHLKEEWLKEPCFANTLSLAKKADSLLTGLATPAAIEAVPIWDKDKEALFPHLEEAAGFIFGRPYTIQGKFIVDNDPVLGLDLSDIANIPNIYAICNHKFKARSMIGALRTGLLTHVLLNESTAAKIIHLLLEK